MCLRITSLTKLLSDLSFNSMRDLADEVTIQFEDDLIKMASDGENTQYIVTSICTALVVVSTVIILPFFTCVLRDKSNIISIFADIEHDEILEVIESSKNFNIKNINFKKSWIESCDGKQEELWEFIMKKHNKEKDEKKENKIESNSLPEKSKELPGKESKKISVISEIEKLPQENEEELKRTERRETLGQIE